MAEFYDKPGPGYPYVHPASDFYFTSGSLTTSSLASSAVSGAASAALSPASACSSVSSSYSASVSGVPSGTAAISSKRASIVRSTSSQRNKSSFTCAPRATAGIPGNLMTSGISTRRRISSLSTTASTWRASSWASQRKHQ